MRDQPINVPANCARASVCIIAAVAAAISACAGDARRTVPEEPLEVRLGTFMTRVPGTLMGVRGLAELFTSEPLVSVGFDGRPVYRLATSSTESSDGRILTFRLRRDVKFHSGELVTAERVRELLLPKMRTSTEIDSVHANSADTLSIHLEQPYSFELAALTDFTVADSDRPELRTGPFRIISSEPAVVLEGFKDYYLGAPAVKRLSIREYPSHRAAWTAMLRGEVNFLHEVNRDAIEFVERGGNVRAYHLLRPYYIPLVLNVTHPVLSRREVRTALDEAVNREEIVQKGMRGHGQTAEGPFWPHHWAYEASSERSRFNPAAARIRLDAAGLPVLTGEARMPARFQFTCLVPADDARFERIALIVQRQLFDVGVDMQIMAVPQGRLMERLRTGDFDAFLFEMTSGRTLGWVYRFWHSKGFGAEPLLASGYHAADEALERMKQARTDEEVRIAVADVMRTLRRDPPALFLVWPYDVRALDRSIELPYEPDRDVFGTLWQARRAGGAAAAAGMP